MVESQAHVAGGHFPILFAEMARELEQEGRSVEVLTARGWSLAEEPDSDPRIHRLNRVALALYLGVRIVDFIPPRRRSWFSIAVRDTIMALSTRRIAKQAGADEVIMTSMATDPWIWTTFIGPSRALLYQFDPPSTQPWGVVKRFAERVEQRRRSKGEGGVRIAVNSRPSLASWEQVAPGLDPVQLAFTGSRTVPAEPDVRERLGLEPTARIALMFGSPHRHKDTATVWEAFEQLPDWTLVVAGGGAADDYRNWSERHPDSSLDPVLFEGYASETTRQRLHAAADLVVLSFTAANSQDSGTLNDAISSGTPVVVSSPGFASEAVEALGLGALFEAGDPDGLVDAVRRAPTALPRDVIASARERTSARHVARAHLAALDPGRFVS